MNDRRAARKTDEVTHRLEMFGMVAGSVVGAICSTAIILTELTAIGASGGLALLAVPMTTGLAGMTLTGGGLAGGQLLRGFEIMFGGPWQTGTIESGSSNVLVGGLPAARTVIDSVANCDGLSGMLHRLYPPHVPIAEGTKKILINNQNAVRVTMKLVCGGEVKSGCERVLFGGPTARVLPVAYDEDAFGAFLGVVFEGSLGLTLVGSVFLGPEAVMLFLGMYGVCKIVFDILGEIGDAMGPGGRDVLQGGAGVLMTVMPLFEQGRPIKDLSTNEKNVEGNDEIPQVLKNKRQGDIFEEKLLNELSKTQDDMVRHITIKSKGGEGTKAVLDVAGYDKATGQIKLSEAKSSASAPFTDPQKSTYPDIEEHGGTVVGKGKPPFVGGTDIPPTKVDIYRPADLEHSPVPQERGNVLMNDGIICTSDGTKTACDSTQKE